MYIYIYTYIYICIYNYLLTKLPKLIKSMQRLEQHAALRSRLRVFWACSPTTTLYKM